MMGEQQTQQQASGPFVIDTTQSASTSIILRLPGCTTLTALNSKDPRPPTCLVVGPAGAVEIPLSVRRLAIRWLAQALAAAALLLRGRALLPPPLLLLQLPVAAQHRGRGVHHGVAAAAPALRVVVVIRGQHLRNRQLANSTIFS